MARLYLFVAGLLEIVWALSMKQSEGFAKLTPTVITLTTMIGSFYLLSVSLKTIPLGTAYTIWTGIGAVGAFIVGVVLLGEPVNSGRIVAVALVISGLILMRLSS